MKSAKLTMMPPFAKAAFILLAITALSHKSSAQATNYVGLDFTVESTANSFRPGIGVLFERQMTRRSGLQTGVFYRNYVQDGYVTYTDASGSHTVPFSVSERHLSIPVLYKFYTRIVDLSAGPSFDFYMGWKQKNKTDAIAVNMYSIDPNFSVGLLAKVSKRIKLSERLILEPELRVNPVFSFYRTYAGFGLAGKYRL